MLREIQHSTDRSFLKTLIKEKLTIKKLAQLMNKDRGTMSKMLDDYHKLSPRTINNILEHIGYTCEIHITKK